jgi:hypothetical protein
MLKVTAFLSKNFAKRLSTNFCSTCIVVGSSSGQSFSSMSASIEGAISTTVRTDSSLASENSDKDNNGSSSPSSTTIATSEIPNIGPEGGFIELKEGLVSIYYDKNEEVFYNKVQVFNRDISIQVIRLFAEIRDEEQKTRYDKKMERFKVDPSKFEHTPQVPVYGIHVLDALAATGLRSVRYLKEIPGVNKVTINDLLPAATDSAKVSMIQMYSS